MGQHIPSIGNVVERIVEKTDAVLIEGDCLAQEGGLLLVTAHVPHGQREDVFATVQGIDTVEFRDTKYQFGIEASPYLSPGPGCLIFYSEVELGPVPPISLDADPQEYHIPTSQPANPETLT